MILTRIGQKHNDGIFCGFTFSNRTARALYVLPYVSKVSLNSNSIPPGRPIDGSHRRHYFDLDVSTTTWRVPSDTELVIAIATLGFVKRRNYAHLIKPHSAISAQWKLILCAVKLRHLWRRYKAETATPFLKNNYLLFFLFFV